MLGRKNFTKDEIANGKKMVKDQLAAYDKVVASADKAAREAFDPLFFNNPTLALDRRYVHRFPGADYEGKDGNPLNEMRIVVDSIMDHGGVMRDDKQIKLSPDTSVLKLGVGDTIVLGKDEFKRLSEAFFSELEKRFGEK